MRQKTHFFQKPQKSEAQFFYAKIGLLHCYGGAQKVSFLNIKKIRLIFLKF